MMMKYLILFIAITVSCQNIKPVANKRSNSLSKPEANSLKKKLYEEHIKSVLSGRSKEMEDQLIKIGDHEMKFDLRFFGSKPEAGWSLYFSLHGGGGVPDSINEKQWVRHKTLYSFKEGVVIIPRSPTNTWNMWHQDHIDAFFSRLIQNMIILHDVDPNKVYLMGYSAGGDGVYQLAPRMADRFAAAAMMAGHPNETSPLGLRNIGFTIHMGENDTPYDRNKVAMEWKVKLKTLKENDVNGYPHFVQIHKNKGHWMEGLDSSAISWISNFTRNPFPKKVVWKQDDVTHNRFYWLKDNNPIEGSLIIASINGQIVNIEKTNVSDMVIRLNDELVDMDKKVIVKYSGMEIFNDMVQRDSAVISTTIKEYGDPESIYLGEIPISLELVE